MSYPYSGIDLREHPDAYEIGRGEQGVFHAEPYKSELLPLWRFRTPAIARESARALYAKFVEYGKQSDFVGMDMARKFLQMGYTRARRYANHRSGKKYDENGQVLPQDPDALDGEKARAARVFYEKYVQAREDAYYKRLRGEWVERHG